MPFVCYIIPLGIASQLLFPGPKSRGALKADVAETACRSGTMYAMARAFSVPFCKLRV